MATETFAQFWTPDREAFWLRNPYGAQAKQLAMDAVAQTAGVAIVAAVRPNIAEYEGGTVIEIRGSNFTGATGVTIDGTAATGFTVVNDGLIRCTAPAHAVTSSPVDIIVQSPLGNVTLAASLTYL